MLLCREGKALKKGASLSLAVPKKRRKDRASAGDACERALSKLTRVNKTLLL